MVSLRDIAERAGTSVSTVSLVLNGRPSAIRISSTTRQRVLTAAAELGYTPHLAARRLRSNNQSRRSLVLGVACPVDNRVSLVSRIISGMQRYLVAAEEELDGQGYEVQLTVETFTPGELHRLRGLGAPLWYSGNIVTNTAPEDDAFLNDKPIGVPLVVLQRYATISSVNVDNHQAAQEVGLHLVGLGHRRLAVMAPSTSTQAHRLRIEGFLKAVDAAGAHGEYLTASGATWTAGAYQATLDRFAGPPKARPTAIFATNDLLALGIIRAAHDRGLCVPEDLAVVGFDDAEFTQYTIPALTSVHLPIEEMAARATAILLDLIQRKVTPPVQEMLTTRLVVRESCGAKLHASRSIGISSLPSR